MRRTKGILAFVLAVSLLTAGCQSTPREQVRTTEKQTETEGENGTEKQTEGQTETESQTEEKGQAAETIDVLSGDHDVLTVDGADYPLTIQDALGNEIVLESKPERPAVMSGTLLNIWYELGGDSVCTSDLSSNLILYEEREEEMKALPSAGAVYQLNLEAVIATKPDLIITQTGVQTTAAAKLKEMGYTVIETNAKTLQNLNQVYEGFGKMLGAQERAAERISDMNQGIAEIQTKRPEEKLSCVILYVTSNTVSVKLDQSIAGDVAYMIGMENIASGLPADTLGSENTPLDIEYIVEKNPDVVLVTSMVSDNDTAKDMVEQMFLDNPAWGTVRAIKEGRVVYLPQQYYLYNAGPYYLDAVRYMACAVHPEIYGEAEVTFHE